MGVENGLVLLCKEFQIAAAELRVVGVENVVGKEYVGNIVVMDIFHHVLGEIARIDHMHLLEREEKIAWQGIAETVL